MKRNLNKAFTLIELLAVIVILAIIALIATPIILGIVEDAKKDAFLRSVELLISTTDIDIATKTFEENYTYEITDGVISDLELGIKNTEGMNGTITYDVNGKEEYAIHNGVYCVKNINNKITVTDYDERCSLFSPVTCFSFLEGKINNYYNYENNDSSKAECPKDVRIPETIDGITVIGIGDQAFYEKNITSVKFPSTLTSIGEDAFAHNKLSGELDLSNTKITNIGDYAFVGKNTGTENQITNVKFPSNIISIGKYAFAYNAISGELDLSNTKLTTIKQFSFAGYYQFTTNQITSVKLPNTITKIEQAAFTYNNFSGELDLSMYPNLTSIDGFSANKITSIKLPIVVTNLESSAFSGNKISGELDFRHLTNLTSFSGFSNNQITSIKLPTTVTSVSGLGSNQLGPVLDLRYLSQLKSVGGFGYNEITNVLLPSSVTTIERSAFQNTKLSGELDLTYLTNLISIGPYAFAGSYDGSTNQITILSIPNTVTIIDDMAFNYNPLSSVIFYGRNDLTGVTLNYNALGTFDVNNITFIN